MNSVHNTSHLSVLVNYSLMVAMSLNLLAGLIAGARISAFGELGVNIDLFEMGHVRPRSRFCFFPRVRTASFDIERVSSRNTSTEGKESFFLPRKSSVRSRLKLSIATDLF